ncbi:MAG: serine/threonine-protein phosphatase [Chloroflexaceae bacterium]|nr:serine/threonine-protein phosphatase [Chloroflexaceae bacterium]
MSMSEPRSLSAPASDRPGQEGDPTKPLEPEQETIPGSSFVRSPAKTEDTCFPEEQKEEPEGETEEEYEADTQKLGETSAPETGPTCFKQGLAAAAMSDIGRARETNQDRVFSLLTTLPRDGVEMTAGLFLVADGMGGHESGDIASQLAVRAVVRHVLSHWLVPTLDDEMMDDAQSLMVSAVQEANRAIWEYGEHEHQDLGSTCTAVLLVGESIYIAHVGDTRVYLLEAGKLQAITADHSAVGRLIELGHLEPSASRDHPLRNQLYRAIGQQPQVEVDFIYQHLGESTHILLCSDGLWGLATEEEMAEVLLRSSCAQAACQELVALANMHGGTDNISAVVVTLPVEEGLFEVLR